MSSLDEVCARLSQQFIDPANLGVPRDAQEEAVRQSLAWMNACLGRAETLTGLDGVLAGSLSGESLPALLAGAAAFALDFVWRKRLLAYPAGQRADDHLQQWCAHLHRQFDLQLDRLRLRDLRTAASVPYIAWQLEETE